MSRHWRIVEQPKSTPSPPAIVVDLHVSLLGPCDEKPLLPSSETQCQLCSKVFSTCKSLREHIRMHGEKMVVKPDEEAAGVMEALAKANGDHNVMVFSPGKRKRSKRERQPLNFEEVDAAVTLLLLSEHSDKTSAYEDWYWGDKEGNSLARNILKEVKLNALDHRLVPSVEFEKPKTDKNSTYEDCYGQCGKENNLVPSVPKKEVELNAFDHGLVGDAELRKPRTNNSVKEVKCGDLSATVKAKSHRCNACGKSFWSGQALGGHMRCHYVPKCNRHEGVVDCPDSVVMKEQKQRFELDSKLLDLRIPALTDGDYIRVGVKSEPEPWCMANSLQ